MKLTRRGRILTAFLLLLLLAAVAAVAAGFYIRSLGVTGKSNPRDLVSVEITDGADASDIGELLENKKVITSALGFRIAVYLHGGAEDIQAGTYKLHRGLIAPDALDVLKEGPEQDYITVTFPEGAWLTDFARILEDEAGIPAKSFLHLTRRGKIHSDIKPDGIETLEGLLFPSTYQVIEADDARSVASRLAEEFDKQVDTVDMSDVHDTGVSTYDAVIVASMIEAEARVARERPKIARVIYNRLQQGMPLGIDATIIYALGKRQQTLTESELAIDSPYNTRTVKGLPPTPIGAAGLASLEAAAHPVEGGWLYYVLKDCDGRHAFSEGYDDFLADKAAYQELKC